MYKGDALEALRGPIEDGVVRLARSGGCVAFSCSFALVAAMNPCPCGHDGDPQRTCECRDIQVLRYKARISGPLLDRFDMEVPMARLTTAELMGEPEGEGSGTIRARVADARALQRTRYRDPGATNASVPLAVLEATIALVPDARALLGTVIESLGLTGRGLNRLLRVARTLADLDRSPTVGADHVTKAAKYRIRHAATRAA